MKDLGDLKYFLGIKVLRSKSGILLNQRKYALKLISNCGLGCSKPASTTLEENIKLTNTDYDEAVGKAEDPLLSDIIVYQRLIGRLLYLTTTRPGIRFVVQVLSQFMQRSSLSHWEATMRLVKGSCGRAYLYIAAYNSFEYRPGGLKLLLGAGSREGRISMVRLTMDPEGSSSQPLGNDAMGVLLARFDALSRDLAKV
ncbi:uncharacterized mitochondrial protein AtMg00810-like [Capsicum annuum]|uniref:uncharacterized mitochondrial protein AtMg00810-like n=1 Tax=Capsicum annuum TaxID=4072 RepID=UPI001FB149DA|nr:uncharacterized mitochondrial protein AtMg00810-like [Capsicum annuum]